MNVYKFLIRIIIPVFILAGCAGSDEKNKADEAVLLKHEIIEELLDNPGLDSYFYIDIFPQRRPLVIVSNGLFQAEPGLTKFGRPVIVLDDKRLVDPGKPYLDIISLNIEDNLAEVRFSYPPEGIVGTLLFQVTGEKLNLIGQSIIER